MKQMKIEQIHQELSVQFGVSVEDVKDRLKQLGINISS